MNSLADGLERVRRGAADDARCTCVARALTCPFGPLIDRFPTTGAVLDVGCGHGLLINLLAQGSVPLRPAAARHRPRCGQDRERRAARRASGVAFSTRRLRCRSPSRPLTRSPSSTCCTPSRREVWA
ncbi:MAG: hypothetical protein MZV70_60745 [Desulfobacterales bacterium]|nr:hypothetical protein [Desulfobacterales bacterium]